MMRRLPQTQPISDRPPTRAQVLSGRALWLSFAAATTGTFMVNLDSSVVNVALPVMQHQFSLSIETLQWVITAYLLVITALLPVTGRLADALGRRAIFLAGIATFVAGSLFSAMAPTFLMLVLARGFQAVGGATIMANVMAIIALVFPLDKRGQALGLIGSVVAAGTLAGPPLGGILTAWLGWRSTFLDQLADRNLGSLGFLAVPPKIPPGCPAIAEVPRLGRSHLVYAAHLVAAIRTGQLASGVGGGPIALGSARCLWLYSL